MGNFLKASKTSKTSKEKEAMMTRALVLAEKGKGLVSPNPMVGAVLVKDGQVIGEGFHQCYGDAHAEVNAYHQAQESGHNIAGAVLFCTLEPCCHTNKQTPPCTEFIVKQRPSKVIIATKDPNPQVQGRGIEQLKAAGIEVEEGVLAKEARQLNRAFNKFIRQKIPFIHLKMAQSLDGKIATDAGDSKWLSDEKARTLVHQWRFMSDGILVGRKSLNQDNPRLDIRMGVDARGKTPYRIVWGDPQKMNLDAFIFSDNHTSKTIILTSKINEQMMPSKIRDFFEERKIKILAENSLELYLQRLGELGIASLLVEGGAGVFTHFVREELFDRLSLFICPKFLGGSRNITQLPSVKKVSDGLSFTAPAPSIMKWGEQILFDFFKEKN